jgi:rhodanese-related sulfurtransferase
MTATLPYLEVPAPDYLSVVDDSTQLVDVRGPDEVARGTLPGFRNIPLDQLQERVGELDANRRVVLLCHSGNRSGAAARFLATQGFDDLVNLSGGMLAVSAPAG